MKTLFNEWEDRWKNMFPRNPTQTGYLRFLKGPDGALKSRFTDSQAAIARMLSGPRPTEWTKTHYTPDGSFDLRGSKT